VILAVTRRTGIRKQSRSASIRLDEWKKTVMSASDGVLCPLLDFKTGVCRLENTSITAVSRIEQEAHGMKASTVSVL
jgi:hypothetical protein